MRASFALGVVALAALAVPAAAADYRTGAVMQVPLNKSQVLRLDRPFARAMVGNAEIADVLPISQGSVYVLGKKLGSTNLTLHDRQGGLIAIVDVVVGPDAKGLQRQLGEILPGEAINVRVANASLVLEGRASSVAPAERPGPQAHTKSQNNVINLLGVGSPQQVLLEVRFAEMTRNTVKQLGINNFTFAGVGGGSGGIGRSTDVTAGPFTALVNLLGASSALSFQIDALERNGLVHTLAQPNLVALSGETASFLAGGEFPIPVGATTDDNGRTVVTIEFKQFGVSLAFTPTVLEDGLINLVVAPEVSSIDRENSVVLNGFNIPGLKVRRAKTQIELRDGQAFAMAGLIASDFEDTLREVPLLGRIPIIGALFRSTRYRKQETELVIIVTPRLVRPVKPEQLSLPTDRVTPPGDAAMFLFGKSESREPLRSLAPAGPPATPAPDERKFPK